MRVRAAAMQMATANLKSARMTPKPNHPARGASAPVAAGASSASAPAASMAQLMQGMTAHEGSTQHVRKQDIGRRLTTNSRPPKWL
eukprot:6972254-Alexandrium_andersonii.AAC.1